MKKVSSRLERLCLFPPRLFRPIFVRMFNGSCKDKTIAICYYVCSLL
jgi:hypothetical protein